MLVSSSVCWTKWLMILDYKKTNGLEKCMTIVVGRPLPIIEVNFLLNFGRHLGVKAYMHNMGGMPTIKRICLRSCTKIFRCLNYMRFSEIEANFGSVHGEPVLETSLPLTERVVGKIYTIDVFLLLQHILCRVCTCKEIASCYLYTFDKYPKQHLQ